MDQARSDRFSDVVLFSHGWNNDWAEATGRYEDFVTGYLSQLRQYPPEAGTDGDTTMLIGIFWPSKLLVGASHEAPNIAAGGPSADQVAAEREEITELSAGLGDVEAERLYELAQRQSLSAEAAAELVSLFLPLRERLGVETADPDEPTAVDVVNAMASAHGSGLAGRAPLADLDELGYDEAPSTAAEPAVAALPGFLDPREIVRAASVWQMKDRARTVGGRGVASLLEDLASAGPRVHLVGHSFGAQVLLTALCTPKEPISVRSALLLEPAVSHLCFSDKVDGSDRPGGYRPALDHVELPILSTFSNHDLPLTKMYQYAMRRHGDVGEPVIAAAGDPPDRYAALGGFGPRPVGTRIGLVYAQDPGRPYDLGPDAPDVYGVNSGRVISGHGDVSNPSTWWMLSQLMHRR